MMIGVEGGSEMIIGVEGGSEMMIGVEGGSEMMEGIGEGEVGDGVWTVMTSFSTCLSIRTMGYGFLFD